MRVLLFLCVYSWSLVETECFRRHNLFRNFDGSKSSASKIRMRDAVEPNSLPHEQRTRLLQNIRQGGAAVGVAAVASLSFTSSASAEADSNKGRIVGKNDALERKLSSMPLGRDAYTILGRGSRSSGGEDDELVCCKLLTGMWQVSGAHGYSPNKFDAVAKMTEIADQGFTTFDAADIYGPAEEYIGEFTRGNLASPSLAGECQFYTKWVPQPSERISKQAVDEAIARSLRHMKSERIDLLQFHWWEYDNKNYLEAMDQLMRVQQEGKILHLGLTNFDTEHMAELVDEGAPLVSNQVSFSVIDDRPLRFMSPYAQEHGIKLLCYGTLLGGFISAFWLGKDEPSMDQLSNVSLRKYFRWIQIWGGWQLFQEMLTTLQRIGLKHDASVSNVALRWVLQQPAVGGAIVGARLGLRGHDHSGDNARVFQFQLDADDLQAIAAVQKKRKGDLLRAFGDCGGEYRRSKKRTA